MDQHPEADLAVNAPDRVQSLILMGTAGICLLVSVAILWGILPVIGLATFGVIIWSVEQVYRLGANGFLNRYNRPGVAGLLVKFLLVLGVFGCQFLGKAVKGV